MNELAINDVSMRHFCTFRLDHRLYGIALPEVREVSMNLPVTPVPHAPSAVRGLANLRSRIYLVLDLRPILGFAPVECTSESRLVILRPAIAENAAILVDQGGDIVSAPERSIEAVTRSAEGAAGGTEAPDQFVTAICKLESELLMVVATKPLVDHVRRLMS